jgi:PleD family two-component response regulator
MPHQALRSPLAVIVSNHEWIARSLDSILAPNGYSVLRTFSGRQILDQIGRTYPDVLLIDAVLPDGSGADLCRRLHERAAVDATTPIVVTSQEAVSRETRLESLRSGAWEHVVFPLDAEELLLRLNVYLAAKTAADLLRETGLVDPLTGCYSPRGLLRRAQELGADAKRNSRAIACLTLAPDFELAQPQARDMNPATPDIVRGLGHLLVEQTRDSDSVGRIGPSEFVVLAPETDVRGALRLAERLTAAAQETVASEIGQPLLVRAGYYAVSNFRDVAIDPVEVMTRATLALRHSQMDVSAPKIQLFRADAAV